MVTAARWFPLALALAAGCAQVDSPNPEMVLPPDYRTSLVPVRSCRSSLYHMNAVVVLTSPTLVNVYNGGPYPLAEGTLLVVEQYRDIGCMDLAGDAGMKKQAQGYDPAAGDWEGDRPGQRRHVGGAGGEWPRDRLAPA